MTSGERLFFLILTIQFLVANPVSLEDSLIPIINSKDLNGNTLPDFIATSNSTLPRNIYHIEYSDTGVDILWEFSLPPGNNGYFTDMVLGDFNNDGQRELIATAWQDEGREFFYVFTADALGFYNDPPQKTGLDRTPGEITQPGKLYLIYWDNDEDPEFILTQGSPNRQVVVCDYEDGKIKALESVGEKILSNTFGPIKISVGDFNGDEFDDIFILNNGTKPTGYFIFSDGSDEGLDLEGYSRLSLLNEQGMDLNFDGMDDLIMVNQDGGLMSDIWGTKSVPLSESGIEEVMIKPDNGIIHLIGVSKSGKIGEYSIDPLSMEILSSEFTPPQFSSEEYKSVYSLFLNDRIVLIHNGKQPELWHYPLELDLYSSENPPDAIQRIYFRQPDFTINHGELFDHPIEGDSIHSFMTFSGDYLPSGMEFDLNEVKLKWTPATDQLGFHELSYKLGLRKKGSLKLDTEDGKKIITQQEAVIEKRLTYLVYVNDPPSFENAEENLTIVRNEEFKWIIPIRDMNADTRLSLAILKGEPGADFILIESATLQIPLPKDTVLVEPELEPLDTVVVDTLVTPEFADSLLETAYMDTVETEFEGFVEEKLSGEDDPLKQKKIKESIEEFKTQEQEYQEKLKTHAKVLMDGKNIWVPRDSLAALGDSIEVIEVTAETADTLIETVEPVEELLDTIQVEEVHSEVEEILDTSFQEITYREVPIHQGLFRWTPNLNSGEYSFSLLTEDGFTSDTLDVKFTVHPEIDVSENETKFTVTVNETFSSSIYFIQEPKSKDFNYHLIDAPENMRIDEEGNINWVPLPTQVDDYSFGVEVTDGIASSSLNYNIYVNSPPVISSRPADIYFLPQGNELLFQLESFDANMETHLSWQLLSGPEGMTLSEFGILKWAGESLGHNNYEIQLKDGIDSTHWAADIYVNSLPIFISEPKMVVAGGENYQYQLTASDGNKINPSDSLAGNKIKFFLIEGPEGMKLAENNTIQWQTDEEKSGEYSVKIAASDGAVEVLQEFSLFVNSLPEILSLDSIAIKIGDTLNFQFQAQDINPGDSLWYELEPLLPGMNLDSKNGQLNWVPTPSQLGIHNLKLQVKDGHGEEGTTMDFRVFAMKLPQLTSKLPVEAFSGLEYKVFLTAADMYGNKLSSPEAIQIESATFEGYYLSDYTKQFKWTPRENDKGDQELVIKLTDENGITNLHRHQFSIFANPCIHCDGNDKGAPADTSSN